MSRPITAHRQYGTSLIEVLVAMVVLAIGLLGLVGLQARLQVLQMESYQRAQALMLLHDMASRITLNRNAVGDYVTAAALGTGDDCPTDTANRQEADLTEWCGAIVGAAELSGVNTVGAMVGGRGCIDDLGGDEYLLTIAWQGLAPLSAPPETVTCGAGEYDSADPDAPCVDDLCRRVVTTVVRIPDLAVL